MILYRMFGRGSNKPVCSETHLENTSWPKKILLNYNIHSIYLFCSFHTNKMFSIKHMNVNFIKLNLDIKDISKRCIMMRATNNILTNFEYGVFCSEIYYKNGLLQKEKGIVVVLPFF